MTSLLHRHDITTSAAIQIISNQEQQSPTLTVAGGIGLAGWLAVVRASVHKNNNNNNGKVKQINIISE